MGRPKSGRRRPPRISAQFESTAEDQWVRMRRDLSETRRFAGEIVGKMSERRPRRIRTVLELLGFIIAIAAFGTSIVGTFQNAASLEGLRESLERESIASVMAVGLSPCVDDSGAITAVRGSTVVTNVGRLPITVVHVGVDHYVNDFAFVRLGDEGQAPRRGAFRLDVGDAVAVQFAVRGTRVPASVTVRLSDGRTVSAEVLEGEGKWTALSDAMGALQNADVECPAGTVPASIPLSTFGDLVSRNP